MHPPRFEFRSYFHCPCCNESVSLPPQGQLGKTGGLHYQPTGSWPIEILCVERIQWGRAIPGEFHEPFLVDPKQALSGLWEIACECVHENCGMPFVIYAHSWINIDARAIADIAARATNQAPACRGVHNLELGQEKISRVALLNSFPEKSD